jgi:hypothetical protein
MDTWTDWVDIAAAEGIPVLGQDWPEHGGSQDDLPMEIRTAIWGVQLHRDAEANGWRVSGSSSLPSTNHQGRAR